jgi:ArsR family transcriptional regulator
VTQVCKQRRDLASLVNHEFFRALSDPTRVALVSCLARCCAPASVSQIATCCAVDLSVVSRHLATLANSGIVESHRQGRHVKYILRFETFAATLRALADAVDECCPDDSPRRKCAGVCCTPHSHSRTV